MQTFHHVRGNLTIKFQSEITAGQYNLYVLQPSTWAAQRFGKQSSKFENSHSLKQSFSILHMYHSYQAAPCKGCDLDLVTLCRGEALLCDEKVLRRCTWLKKCYSDCRTSRIFYAALVVSTCIYFHLFLSRNVLQSDFVPTGNAGARRMSVINTDCPGMLQTN